MTRRSFRALLISVVLMSALANGQSNTPVPSTPPHSEAPTPTSVPPDSNSLEPIRSFLPTYPPSAEKDKLRGLVVIRTVVSAKGDVTGTQVIGGDDLLAQAAIAAVKKWKFRPFLKNGIAVTASTNLPFNFIFLDQLPAQNPDQKDGLNSVLNAISVVGISRAAAEQLRIYQVAPKYPELAELAKIQGTVLLMGDIDKSGVVRVLGPLSGHPLLIKAASDAVSQWRYRPVLLDGQPVNVQTIISVEFSLK